MAHLEVKKNQTKKGLHWLVVHRFWSADLKKYQTKKLTPTVFQDLGFSQNMSLKQARDHAKKLNSLQKVKRKEQSQKVKASERLHDLAIVEGSLIASEQSELFVTYMQDNWQGGEYNLRKHVQHWSKVQKLITEIRN